MKSSTIEEPAKAVALKLPPHASQVIRNIAALFARQVQARCGAAVTIVKVGPATVELAVGDDIGAEGFQIESAAPGEAVRVVGNDERGLLYGVGKLLRTSRYEHGFTPSTWRGTSVPDKPVRGIYFATHYFNYYHTAPVDEVVSYVEELALWGFNSLMVWYDAHHFRGFNDPDAIAFRIRLHSILTAARRLGLGTALVVIGNEAYSSSPTHLRADPTGQRGGYYDEAICPNKPGGLDYTLGILGELFEWARQLRPEYVCIWPYDQGTCGCGLCRPWGANGFLRCVEQVTKLARKSLPGAKIVLSTWLCDAVEWQGMQAALRGNPALCDLIMAEDPKLLAAHGPANMPMLGFPEISMHGMWPWGGFGANPQPARFAGEWQGRCAVMAGGFPYSEGIFEDINKALWAQLYWCSNYSIEEILNEYVSYEYSPDAAADVLGVITTLETNHRERYWPGELEGVTLTMNWFPSKGAPPHPDPGAEEAFAAVRRVDARLPVRARNSWRWRILYLRAMLDSELKTNGPIPNETCMAGFRELEAIFHVIPNTDPCVRPPLS